MRIPACTKRTLLIGLCFLPCGCGPSDRSDTGNAADRPAPKVGTATIGNAAAPAHLAGPARDEAELIRLERDYASALIRKDRAFLMRFYAPDWRGGNWMGFWSKSTLLKSVLNERYVVKSMNLRDLKIRLLGDVAIVQGVDDEVTSVDGRDTSGKWAFTDVFERRGGAWVAVASHTSEIKPSGE
jgi:hypothetical protein